MGKKVLFFVTAFLFSLVLLALSIGLSVSMAFLVARSIGYQASLSQIFAVWFAVYGLPLWLLQGRYVPNVQVSARITLYIAFPLIIVLFLAPLAPMQAFFLLGFITMEPFYRWLDRRPIRAH